MTVPFDFPLEGSRIVPSSDFGLIFGVYNLNPFRPVSLWTENNQEVKLGVVNLLMIVVLNKSNLFSFNNKFSYHLNLFQPWNP